MLIISLACISLQGVYKKWPILTSWSSLNLCITSGFLGLNHNKNKHLFTRQSALLQLSHSLEFTVTAKSRIQLTIWTSVLARFVRNHTKPDRDEGEECDERLTTASSPTICDQLREPLVEANCKVVDS